LTGDCLFAVTVSPTYPSQSQQAIIVYPLIGFVAAKAVPSGQTWVGTVRKITNWSATNTWSVKTGDTAPVEVFLNGCGHYDKEITPVNGVLTMNLADAYTGWGQDLCVLDGVVISPVFKNLLLNVLATQYLSSFSLLPLPTLQLSNGTLAVTADPAVTVVALDSTYTLDAKGSFGFDSSQPHVLRLLTVKGRAVFGSYDPKKGKWTWAQ
jgi:hypothetical protein